jgi:hypothetical protein
VPLLHSFRFYNIYSQCSRRRVTGSPSPPTRGKVGNGGDGRAGHAFWSIRFPQSPREHFRRRAARFNRRRRTRSQIARKVWIDRAISNQADVQIELLARRLTALSAPKIDPRYWLLAF